jgi:hypothetical protein
MQACKIIGGILGIVGIIIALAGAVQKEPWGTGGVGLALLGRVISEKIPDWFDL